MKAYKFRLEAVLTLREQAEQEAEQRFAHAYTAVQAAKANVRAAEAAIDAAEQAQRAQLAAGSRAGQVEQLRAYTVLLDERRLHFERELAETRRQAEIARHQLMAATQQRETLERLRSRQKRVHDYEAARAEQKAFDECAGRARALGKAGRASIEDL
jgi:flagellar protein FliJ